MKLKMVSKLRRLITIPDLDKKSYRELQAGKIVNVSRETAKILIDGGYCELIAESEVDTDGNDGIN